MNDSEPQEIEEWTIDHPQGRISEYRQGDKIVRKLWYTNGILEESKTYKNGKPEGECLRWHDNGSLGMREFYKNGKLEERKTWMVSGSSYDHELYHLGLLDGRSRHWYYDGSIRSIIFYREGKLEGECKQYGSIGDLRCSFYRSNILIISDFTPRIKKSFLRLKDKFGSPIFRKKREILGIFLIRDLIFSINLSNSF